MRATVLYVSKAMVVAAYRDKLRHLERYARVTAVVPDRWGSTEVERLDGGEAPARIAFRRPALHGHNHFHFYPGIDGLIERVSPDVVHVDEEPYSAVTGQIVWRCRARGIACLFFAWQNLEKSLPPPFGAMRRWVYREASAGIAGTEAAARVLRSTGFEGRVAVIPQFGVDPDRFSPDPVERSARRASIDVADDEFLVGFGGRLVAEKGLDLLVDAFAGLADAHLLVLGSGPERRTLEVRVRERGLSDRVRFLGQVRSTEMAGWLAALDALVLPSRSTPSWSEQFGRILVEAMATAVAVVGSDSGEIPRVMGDAGLVFPEEDVPVLAERLRRLRDDPDLRRALGCRGRDRVRRHFTQDLVARRTADVYAELLQGDDR